MYASSKATLSFPATGALSFRELSSCQYPHLQKNKTKQNKLLPGSMKIKRYNRRIHIFIYLFIYVFLGSHLRYMEVPGPGVESELQLPAYATATATPDPSHDCDLHDSSRQRRILHPLSEARDPNNCSIYSALFLPTSRDQPLHPLTVTQAEALNIPTWKKRKLGAGVGAGR